VIRAAKKRTGYPVIAPDVVAALAAALALALALVLVLAAVGAAEIVVFPVAIEGQPAADTADSGLGLDTGGSKIYSADMQVYRCC
jgi:hypothetical protein